MADAGDDLRAATDLIVWPGPGQFQGTLQVVCACPCYSKSMAVAIKASRLSRCMWFTWMAYADADTRQPHVLHCVCLHVPHRERRRRLRTKEHVRRRGAISSLARSSSAPAAFLHAQRYARPTAADEDAAGEGGAGGLELVDGVPPSPCHSMRHYLRVRLALVRPPPHQCARWPPTPRRALAARGARLEVGRVEQAK